MRDFLQCSMRVRRRQVLLAATGFYIMCLVIHYHSVPSDTHRTFVHVRNTSYIYEKPRAVMPASVIRYPTVPSNVSFDLKSCTDSEKKFNGTFEENLKKIANLQFPEADKWISRLGLDKERSRDVSPLPVIVTAATPYYFDISQGLIKTIHEVLLPKYPQLKFIYYSLGLLPGQLRRLKRHCRCEVRDFAALKDLPPHARNYRIYAFKPIVVAMLFQEFGHVWWVDASVRFLTNELEGPLQYLKNTSSLYFTYSPFMSIAKHTFVKTFNYFNEHPCPYGEFGETESGNTAFYDSNVSRIIVKKWMSCALIEDCIAPHGHIKSCTNHTSTIVGNCHRYDQSVLGIILRRLFHEQNDFPKVEKPFRIVKVMRENRLQYLPF